MHSSGGAALAETGAPSGARNIVAAADVELSVAPVSAAASSEASPTRALDEACDWGEKGSARFETAVDTMKLLQRLQELVGRLVGALSASTPIRISARMRVCRAPLALPSDHRLHQSRVRLELGIHNHMRADPRSYRSDFSLSRPMPIRPPLRHSVTELVFTSKQMYLVSNASQATHSQHLINRARCEDGTASIFDAAVSQAASEARRIRA